MTILAALQEVFDDLPALKTFIYADMNEANATYMDKLLSAEYPAMLVLPFSVNDTPSKSGKLKSTFEFYAFVLDKGTESTVDYSASQVETDLIAPMRLLARRFMHKLNEHNIIDPETNGVGQTVYAPLYAETDAHLFGVSIRVTVPVMENEIICHP